MQSGVRAWDLGFFPEAQVSCVSTWLGLSACGRLWYAAASCVRLRQAVAGCGRLRQAVGFGGFWDVFGRFCLIFW